MNANYKNIFTRDDGLLLDIKVFDVNEQDWQRLLALLERKYLVVYSENGVAIKQPDLSTIRKRAQTKTAEMEVLLPGFTLRAHFLETAQIEMDLRPEDVDSAEKANAVFELMSGIACELRKETFLIPEYASATKYELKRMAICSADRDSGKIKYYEAPFL